MPDDLDARLVVLPPEQAYSKEPDSAGRDRRRSASSRRAATRRASTATRSSSSRPTRSASRTSTRRSAGTSPGQSILAEKVALNLDPHQVRQAETQLQAANGAVTARLPETYQWLLVPEQVKPDSPITWQAARLSGGEALAVRASRKLRSDETLLTSLGSTILRKHLDEVPLWRGDHVAVRQLVEDFARYLYLPRLAGPEVLVAAARDGVALLFWPSDTFAYAESYDEEAKRYRGLRGGQAVSLFADSAGLLVKSDVAKRQIDAETVVAPPGGGGDTAGGGADGGSGSGGSSGGEEGGGGSDGGADGGTDAGGTGPAPRPRRFHGTVTLDPTRVGRDASRIADEVIAHLAAPVGAVVTVTLEIEAYLPDGASDQVVRTVTENGRTLRFTSQGFETD